MKEQLCSTCVQRRWAPRLFREHVQERLVRVRLQGACCPARREEEFDNEVEHVLEKGLQYVSWEFLLKNLFYYQLL